MPGDLGCESCGREWDVLVTNLILLLGLSRLPPSYSSLVGTPPMPSSPSTATSIVEMPHDRPWDLNSQADAQRTMMQLGVS